MELSKDKAQHPEPTIEEMPQSFMEKIFNIFPHPIALVFLVTLLVILLALAVTGESFASLFEFWGTGLVNNFAFNMQFVLLLLLSYALAITPVFKSLISRVASLAQLPVQAVLLVSSFSIVLGFFNWGLGVIGGIFLAREIAARYMESEKTVNYPLLIAAGMSGVLVWESGISGNALLHITQENHLLAEQLGVLSLQQTAFSGLNITVTLLLLIAVPIALAAFGKAGEKNGEIDADNELLTINKEKESRTEQEEKPCLAVRLEKSWILSLVFGLLALLYVMQSLASKGMMDMPTYLFLLIALGIVFRREPMTYQQDVLKAVQVSWVFYLPLVFYGAVQGIVDMSGMSEVIAGWFSALSNGATFPMMAVVGSAVVNLFIPHAGGQWLVEGNSLIKAASDLGVSNIKTVLAFSYGAGWAKLVLVSLFATLLGITGVRISQLARYLVIMMLVSMAVFILAVTLIPV